MVDYLAAVDHGDRAAARLLVTPGTDASQQIEAAIRAYANVEIRNVAVNVTSEFAGTVFRAQARVTTASGTRLERFEVDVYRGRPYLSLGAAPPSARKTSGTDRR